MGDQDPDFRSPEDEAAFVAQALPGRHQMVPGAGHYPMGEQPEIVLDAITSFLAEADA